MLLVAGSPVSCEGESTCGVLSDMYQQAHLSAVKVKVPVVYCQICISYVFTTVYRITCQRVCHCVCATVGGWGGGGCLLNVPAAR